MMNTVDMSVSEVHSKTPRNILRGLVSYWLFLDLIDSCKKSVRLSF